MTVERTRAYYDDFATTYDAGRDRGYHALVDDLETSVVLPHARAARVLEVGCGTGLVLEKIAAVAAEAQGVDVSPGMLERARARGLSVSVADARELPFEDARFDLVYSLKVLAHVPEIERALSEMARVTRPGGRIVYELYNRRSLRYLARALAGARSIGDAHAESDISTRWDDSRRARTLAPHGTVVEELVGVRIATPAAALFRLPLIGRALGHVERRLARSPLSRFGGFLVVVARKDDPLVRHPSAAPGARR